MHRLLSTADLTLSLPLLAAVLSAFFVSQCEAQDIKKGMRVYEAKCSACHSAAEHGVGPAHAGVLGRRAGAAAGYEYSVALSKSNLIWNHTTLNAWLTDPEKLIPGQRMGYRLSLASERAHVIAYLATIKNKTCLFFTTMGAS